MWGTISRLGGEWRGGDAMSDPGPDGLRSGETKEFRLPWWHLALGVVAFVFFTAMGVVSVFVAATNRDGSFRYPVPTAIVLGFLWSSFSLGSLYLIASYVRARLFLTSRSVRVVGCFGTREADLGAVTEAVWKPGGDLVLVGLSGRVKVPLTSYRQTDRAEIVRLLRPALAGVTKDGWEGFERQRVPGGSSWERQRSRGRRRYVWVNGVLTGLTLGSAFMLREWFKRPVDLKFFVPALAAFGVGGYFVGVYRWNANEAAFRSRGGDTPS
jgi:hypothetical protein